MIVGKLNPNIIGSRNGRLVAVRRIPKADRTGNPSVPQLECHCDCGNVHRINTNNFHRTQSCGCYKSEKAKTMNLKDITGKKFFQLTAIKRLRVERYGSVWECLCDCGNTTTAKIGDITSGNTKSCGCRGKVKDITGHRFGKLVAIKKTGRIKFKADVWEFKCDCGKTIEVSRHNIARQKGSRSCGCIQCPDLAGRQFGWLTVIQHAGIKIQKNGQRIGTWLCKCRCGKEIILETANIKRGHVSSCGCLLKTALFLGRNTNVSPLNVPIGMTSAYISYRKVVNKCNSILERK